MAWDPRVTLGPMGSRRAWGPGKPHEATFPLGTHWARHPCGTGESSLPRNPRLAHKTIGPLVSPQTWGSYRPSWPYFTFCAGEPMLARQTHDTLRARDPNQAMGPHLPWLSIHPGLPFVTDYSWHSRLPTVPL